MSGSASPASGTSPNTTPKAPEALSFPPHSRTASYGSTASKRIKRKPLPSADIEDLAITSAGAGAGGVSSSPRGAGTSRASEESLGRTSAIGSPSGSSAGGGTTRPSPDGDDSASHSFPPKASPALSSDSSVGIQYPYSSTNPTVMSSAAYPANDISASTNNNNNSPPAAQKYPGLTSRPSIHSHRTSIAPESVFGTAPTGVIGKTKPREIVRVERDYSAGETCQFWSGWIWELEGRVSPTDFQNTLNELNTVLASAHDPYKSCFDNCLAVMTLYLSPYVLTSHYAKEMKNFDRTIDRANREIYNPAGLNILSPRRTAFLFLEIEYY